MKLKSVYVRFYKSFNFDYLRKYHGKAQAEPWDMIDNLFYPFIRVRTSDEITTIVGANEAGKSHLLSAIEKGISGRGITREDFCRHSLFFSGKRGHRRLPDFGFEWHDLKPGEAARVRDLCGLGVDTSISRFWTFRFNGTSLEVFWLDGSEFNRCAVTEEALAELLPRVFRIDPNAALPESVTLRQLYGEASQSGRLDYLSRQNRWRLAEALDTLLQNANAFTFSDTAPHVPTEAAKGMKEAVNPLLSVLAAPTESGGQLSELQLAHDLICKIAGEDVETLKDLDGALRDGKEGYAQSIVADINHNLETALNFSRFWAQDSRFALKVEARSHDLFFAVHDRTGREYSFDERSSGLKFFLSYYIQYLAHEPSDRSEILVMDEPDTYLSSQAQQDLLKIFHGFAHPDNGRPPVQVIYVTHSPFLIDKNHGDRIRVLEKGIGDEGTRVVPSVSINHYEPLRSAFGAFLGETTFIGNCNLMVEGMGDQILLAGAASHLNRNPLTTTAETESLDLNRITIAPAGSASHIPYLTLLARGRDEVRPAVVVLLDSDGSGDDARKTFKRKPYSRALTDNYILQIGELAQDSAVIAATNRSPIEIEDLVPLPLALHAARAYCRDICGVPDGLATSLSIEQVEQTLLELAAQRADGKKSPPSVFDALEHIFETAPYEELHIEKVGFARFVIDLVSEIATRGGDLLDGTSNGKDAVRQFETNMKALFRQLGKRQRAAERELTVERVAHKIDRAKNAFLQDHPVTATREQATILLEKIESLLDDSRESDPIRLAVSALHRDFKLDEDVTTPVENYDAFVVALERIRYAEQIALNEQSPNGAGDSTLGLRREVVPVKTKRDDSSQTNGQAPTKQDDQEDKLVSAAQDMSRRQMPTAIDE
jgi:predicted ATPase